MYQTDPPRSPKEVLPTMYDLPSEDPQEPGLPDEFHNFQAQLLRETFCPPTYPQHEVFVASDLNLYYDVRHPLWYKRPDWFAVVGVPRLYEGQVSRLSYVTWQEGINPLIVVELLSPSTEQEDLGQRLREANQPPTKWEVYERILRIPYYVVFDGYTNQMQAFQLQGDSYIALDLPESRLGINSLQLSLGTWTGVYQDINRQWLRWYDSSGSVIPCEQEKTLAAEKIVEQERRRVEQLIAQLRALGVEPNFSDER